MNLYPIINSNITKKQHEERASLAKLEKAVFKKLPVLGQVYEKSGNLSVLEFTKKQFSPVSSDLVPMERREEVIGTITAEITRLLGTEVADRIKNQLERNYMVITADHHGPLTHQNFVTSNLLAHHAMQEENEINDILVLSCANISFDNTTFPRGHLLHIDNNNNAELDHLTFFSRKVRPLTISGYQAYTEEAVKGMYDKVIQWVREGMLQKSAADKLLRIIQDVYADPSVLNLSTFSEQVTKTNFLFWKKLVGENSSNLLYLEQEQIVNNLILDHHIDQETIVHRILFDESVFNTFIKYFDNVSRGFSLRDKSGTYLFWGTPKDQKYRLQLWKEGNRLVSPDGSFSVELTPQAIAKAISSKELLPSTLLSFIILSFYYGMTLVGGRYQTTYLTKMKIAYNLFCREIGHDETTVLTNKQSMTFPSIALFSDKNNSIVSATGMDLLVYGDENYMDTVKYMVENTTVAQSIARDLPECYRKTVHEEMREEALNQISVPMIDNITNLTNTLRVCGIIG